MRAVGIRELKAKLSEYVRIAKEGEVVLVTERGRIVAELRPPTVARELPPELGGLQALADRGLLTVGLPHDPSVYVRTGVRCAPGTAKALLNEEREDRV